MNTSSASGILSQAAAEPFHFNSSASLIQIERDRAGNLGELLSALRSCPEESIFQHTIQTLQEHHYIREGFSNDFAHWAYTDCNEAGLAERLSNVDVRTFTSLESLREQIVKTVQDYLKANPAVAERPALKPFYFLSSESVVVPTPFIAHNLREFIDELGKVSIHSIHHHFIEARLRLKMVSNDFSMWLEKQLGLNKVAANLNRIDIYTATLEDVRAQLVRILQTARA
ncbi:MAG TPA: DUF5752 family protein [Terriglobales bacterium]|nr:DUF5752 family protein [Terriglobales bacterium]